MLGAIIGDIVGSVYEWHNIKTKDFPLFRNEIRPTYHFSESCQDTVPQAIIAFLEMHTTE